MNVKELMILYRFDELFSAFIILNKITNLSTHEFIHLFKDPFTVKT
jgi:hypothetical protein